MPELLIDAAERAIETMTYAKTVRDIARAAVLATLEALREPSEKMTQAGYLTVAHGPFVAGPTFRAMIDAAIEEVKNG